MQKLMEEIRTYIQDKLKPERFRHSIGVMETAREMAIRHGEDPLRAELAGILHDCGKGFNGRESLKLVEAAGYVPNGVERFDPSLLHGRVGALVARDRFGVKDEGILSAIACHTTGKTDMSRLDRIVYVADYMEPGREGDWVHPIRAMAYQDLDRCVLLCADSTLTHLMRKGLPVHPDTIHMRNQLLIEGRGRWPA